MFKGKENEPVKVETKSIAENIADKDIKEYKEVREIIINLIVNSDDKEFKEKMLKVYDYVNKPRIYQF